MFQVHMFTCCIFCMDFHMAYAKGLHRKLQLFISFETLKTVRDEIQLHTFFCQMNV